MKKRFLCILLMLLLCVSLAACGSKADADDNIPDDVDSPVYIDTKKWAFVPTLYEFPEIVRTNYVSDDSFYFGNIELGCTAEEMEAPAKDSGWFATAMDVIISEANDPTIDGSTVQDIFFTDDRDMIKASVIFDRDTLTQMNVSVIYDITNPSYDEFRLIAEDFLKDFSDAEGIELKKTDKLSDGLSEVRSTDAYVSGGYDVNEVTFMDFEDKENKIYYSFIIEHYSKSEPVDEKAETKNIAVISYSKSRIK